MKFGKLLLILISILCIYSTLHPVFALDLSMETPTNTTYTSSYALPLEYTVADGNGTCYYIVEGRTINLPGCPDSTYSVDYDGSYTLELYALNDSDTFNENMSFTIDRTTEFEQGKPFLAGLIIIILVMGAFFCLKVNDSIEETYMLAKFIIIFMGICCFITAGFSSLIVINEYLKFDLLGKNLTILSWAIGSLTVFLALYLTMMFIKKALQMRQGKWQ